MTHFYDEHVEADAVHENIAAWDLAGGLAAEEPEVAADILFGARVINNGTSVRNPIAAKPRHAAPARSLGPAAIHVRPATGLPHGEAFQKRGTVRAGSRLQWHTCRLPRGAAFQEWDAAQRGRAAPDRRSPYGLSCRPPVTLTYLMLSLLAVCRAIQVAREGTGRASRCMRLRTTSAVLLPFTSQPASQPAGQNTAPEKYAVNGAIHIMPPIPHWHRGRMVLIGEAVHEPSSHSRQRGAPDEAFLGLNVGGLRRRQVQPWRS